MGKTISISDLSMILSSLALMITAIASFGGWMQGRRNAKIATATHVLVNGQSQMLRDAAFARGVEGKPNGGGPNPAGTGPVV
jgi:hypothetical protein